MLCQEDDFDNGKDQADSNNRYVDGDDSNVRVSMFNDSRLQGENAKTYIL